MKGLTMRRGVTIAAIVAGCLSVAGLLAFSWSDPGPETSRYEFPAIELSAPNRGLEDWVSYADHVLVVTVVAEAEKGERQVHGDGTATVGRTVTGRVERVLWSASGIEPLGSEVEVSDWGWSFEDGEARVSDLGMQVGAPYLIPLARFDDGWGFLGARAFPIEDDALPEELSDGQSWLRDLAGLSLSDLQVRLAAATPDPRAEELRHLPANERASAVFGIEDAFFAAQ